MIFSQTYHFSSDLSEVSRLESVLDELQQNIQLHDDMQADIELVITEALTNAIIHGNQSDPAKQVTLTVAADQSKIVCSVQDEGDGFNPDTISNPLNEQNLLKSGGRGVFLIREYADEVTFNDTGNQISITFFRT